jgi:hypothetical protein
MLNILLLLVVVLGALDQEAGLAVPVGLEQAQVQRH